MFCSIGNTCYRINSDNIKVLSILPIFTEGIFGHFRTLYLLLRYGNFITIFYYLYHLVVNLYNPFGALVFVFYIDAIFNNIY